METTVSFTDAEKKVLKLIKEKKSEYIAYCKKFWGMSLFTTTSGTTGLQAELRKRYFHNNPRMGDELLTLERGIYVVCHLPEFKWGLGLSSHNHDFLVKLRQRFKEDIKGPKKRVKYPHHMLMLELITRDFIHIEDLKVDKDDFYIQGPYNLVYKMAYASRIMAKKALRRFAIPLCTIKQYKPKLK